MGSAEQEIIVENIPTLVPEDEVRSTTVSFLDSDQLEDKKNAEDVFAASGSPATYIQSDQTVDNESISSKLNGLSETTSSLNQKSDQINGSGATLLDAKDETVELQSTAKVQNTVDKVTQHCESNAVESYSDNASLPNCDAPGVELPSSTELPKNSILCLTNDIAVDSGSNIQTSSGQAYRRRSTLSRVRGSGGHSQTTRESGSTHWTDVVPLSNDQQYSFRYGSFTMYVLLMV